ncbi:DUF3987 domain-containing protein [Candidatus Uabimicrobium amorphum]|uniref:Zinc finger CHC2-type domain-containing protein n=1 Tax=Uabimicrobium amorphum TaxID=2596890 RepID=A0A5S9ISQ7_UABAM|nr:DUF3987 domain-containing protein [Candidatus Uabimicrobium amorphum]BBM87047.1 hypothetical protein UABAM_05450 [Candidatus Uabimicrobium amorphum]
MGKENIFVAAKQKNLKSYIENRTGIKLKKVGSGYRAETCPFCNNKSKGFGIKNEFFHCFACGKEGDIIDFESIYSNCEPHEAARKIIGENIPFYKPTVSDDKNNNKNLFLYIWDVSERLDFSTALNWLKNQRGFDSKLAEISAKYCSEKLRINSYQNTISIVAPIYSYSGKNLVGIEKIGLQDSQKIAHGTKKGMLCFDTNSEEVVIVESLANALCLASVGITGVSIFGVTNTNNISEIISAFPNRKIYIWFDKGTEEISEEIINLHQKVKAIYFEDKKSDKFDVNDLLKEANGNFSSLVQQYIKNASSSQTQLERENLISRNKVPKFPICCLPEPLRRFCKEVAEAVDCPTDFVATPLLTVAAGVIGSSKKIQVKKSWTESCAIYSAVVAAPGSGKSPALIKVTDLLKPIEKENIERNNESKEEYLQSLAEYESDIQTWKKDKKKGLAVDSPPQPPEPFYYIRTHIADATVESIAEILANNPQGVVLIRDELTAWVKSHNQYKGGNGSDRQFFLSVWAGASSPVDRKGKAPQYLTDPFLSITGAIPPKELDTLKKGMKDDGFLDRILFSYPDPIHSTEWSEKDISVEAETEIQKLFLNLYNNNEPKIIEFTEEAKKLWIKWFVSHKKTSLEQAEILQNPLNKMPGQLLRISLILAVIADEPLLTKLTLQNAIEIIKYYKQHLKRVLGILDETADEEKVRKIMNYAKKRSKSVISAQDIYKSHFMGIRKSAPAKELLKWASEQGIGTLEKDKLHLHGSVFEDFQYGL